MIVSTKAAACAGLACALLAIVQSVSPASAGVIWDGGGSNDNIDNAANWDGDTLPPLAGSMANLVFAGTTRLTPAINVPISPLSIRFDSTAGAFTLGGANSITIGSSSIAENGTITNDNALPQTIGTPVVWNRGTINAAAGDIVLDGAINIGGGSNAGGRSLNIDGDHDVFFNGTIEGTGSSTSGGGVISKIGGGIWHITANSPLWAGRLGIDGGILRASASDALGDPGSRTLVQGGGSTGSSRLELAGGVTFAGERLEFTGRLTGASPVHLSNFSGNNTWTGPIFLNTGGGEYGIESAADKLTISSDINNNTGNAEVRTVRFAGAGDGEFRGLLLPGTSTGPFALRKDGAGSWSLSNAALEYAGDTTITGGTLAFAPGVSLSASPNISISGDSTLDLAGGNLDRLPGQTLIAAGTINATINDVGGTTVPGTANAAGTLTVGNHLNFNGGGTINFDLGSTTAGGGVNDLIVVNGNLSLGGLTNVALNNLEGSLANGTYRLFTYGGTLTGGAANLQLTGLSPTRQTLALSTATPQQVNLDIAGAAANLTWTGDGGFNLWDLNSSQNWSNGGQQDSFFNLDHVSFVDVFGAPVTTVNISQNVVPASVRVDSTLDYTFTGSGGISGGAGITKTGPGKLIVETNNDNFGPTLIIGGTIQVGNGSNTGSLGSGNIINSGLLVFNRSTSLTVPGIITGPGNLEQAGAGTTILLGQNTYLGTTTISAGTLQIGNNTELGSIGPGDVIDNGLLIISQREDFVFANQISGTGAVDKRGAGTIEFTALNTYTGATTINDAVLLIDNLASGGVPSDIGASPSDAANLTIRTNATLQYVGSGVTTDRLFTIGNARIESAGTGPLVFSNTGSIGISGGNRTLTLQGDNTQDNTLAPAIVDGASGITTLVKAGEGTWIISGDSTFTGTTSVNAGALRVASASALGSTTNGTSVGGDVAGKGRLELSGGITVSGETLSIGGRQGGSAPVPHLSNVGGDNTWAGPIRLVAGGVDYTLQSDAGTLTIGGDITQTLTTLERFLNLQGTGNGVVNGAIINGTGSQITSLRKRGAGTWTLNGANTYTGSTAVEAGTLVANTGIVGPGATTVGGITGPATLVASHLRQASLTVGIGGRATLKPGSDTTVLSELLLPAGGPAVPGTFDITNNKVIVDYTGASPEALIRLRILEGRGGSGLGKTWDGPGITSSTAADDPPNAMSVGYAVNGTLPLMIYTTFGGQPVDASSVLMRYTRTGDANLDGVVNNDDVTIVGANYAPDSPKPRWDLGDFDYDGSVDNDDITLLGAFYNPDAPPIPVPDADWTTGNVAAVPEPGTVLLLAVGLALIACWRPLIAMVGRRPRRA